MVQEKLPPHDIAAEEAVIGSLLLGGENVYEVATFLEPGDFFREANAWLYQSCLSLYQRNEAINQVTVAQELARQDRLEAVGGAAHLIHLLSIVPTPLHIRHYAQIVHRLAVMRRLIAAAGQIAAIGYEAGPDVDGALNRAEDVLFRLRHGQSPRDFVHVRQVLDQYFEEAAPVAHPQDGQGLRQVFTGFGRLDEFLGGLQPADLVILGARPSMGKTSLVLTIARNAAFKPQQARVAIFSLEMSRQSLVQRFLSMQSGVDTKRVRLGMHTEEEEARIMDATGILSEASIYVDDSPQLRPVEMRSKARRLHFERGIDLIIVDYLQLLQGEGRTDNRVQEVSEVSRSLKALARELNVPVLAVSQLSRAVEWRASHRPQLSDLRESGSIEQDADVVLFIHREELFYKSEEEWEKVHPEKEYPRGQAEVIIAKHRNGPTGELTLWFEARTAEFRNYELARQERLP